MSTAVEQLLQKGLSFNQAGEHRLVIGEKPIGIKDSEDVEITNATMNGLLNFVISRKDDILQRAKESHFLVESRESKITLVVGEKGGRKLVGDADRTPVFTIIASSQFSDDYEEVKKYMGRAHPSAHELAMTFRERSHLFENDLEWARVVRALRDTSVKVNKIQKETSADAGLRETRLNAEITDGQLDLEWNFHVSIYEGEAPELIRAKAIWEVQEDHSTVKLILLNNGLVLQERAALKAMTARTIAALTQTLGQDALPMLYVDSHAEE